jgi:hypothetical protein
MGQIETEVNVLPPIVDTMPVAEMILAGFELR